MAPQTGGEPDLDPENWDEFRADAHQALDDMLAHLESVREGKVWEQAPAEVKAEFARGLPRTPESLADVLDVFEQAIVPYANGNRHPLFMGWVHGAGTPVGMVAEMLAAGLNSNCGGRNHIALDVERQVVRWAAEMLGFPDNSSGVFVTGTSMANFLAVLVARNAALGHEVRQRGLRGASQLAAYASVQAHGCVVRAIEMAGIGSDNLRLIPVDGAGRIRIELLKEAVARDRATGLKPFLVAGTAGTVNTGAMDDLAALADFAQAEKLWFHIDGAFGALCALSPKLKPLVAGIGRADSVAFDFHKWAHVPYDAGFLLVRDAETHRRTFASENAYLTRAPSGLAAGDLWPCDLGPDLSRGFRALKTWFTFRVFGTERIAACIEHTCEVAKYLEAKLKASPDFETCAPVALNIVCFSLKSSADGIANKRIVMELHDSGAAAPSITILSGKPVIRCAIVNHRTTMHDIDRFMDALNAAAGRFLP
jgi:glutamate/tyrosine decarboxylase-like PLP-dependent enzyme